MPKTPPTVSASDWSNKTAEMTRLIEQENAPVYVTLNTHGITAYLSAENHEAECSESEVYAKLKEAEAQRDAGMKTIPHGKVMADLRKRKTYL